MNKQKQIEAMAVLDGFEIAKFNNEFRINGRRFRYRKDGTGYNSTPDYFTDNEIDRMVRGLDKEDTADYVRNLCAILSGKPTSYIFEMDRIILIGFLVMSQQASEEQKVEAYLRAKGQWK